MIRLIFHGTREQEGTNRVPFRHLVSNNIIFDTKRTTLVIAFNAYGNKQNRIHTHFPSWQVYEPYAKNLCQQRVRLRIVLSIEIQIQSKYIRSIPNV